MLRFGSVGRLLDGVCKRLLQCWGHSRNVETANVHLFWKFAPRGRLGRVSRTDSVWASLFSTEWLDERLYEAV